MELSLEIGESMNQTRRKLLEHFDDEVREKLRVRDRDAKESLSRTEHSLMNLTRHVLGPSAEFTSDSRFRLTVSPSADIPAGVYELPRRSGEAHLYRLGHPLAEHVLASAIASELPVGEIELNYAEHQGLISVLEPLVSKSGWYAAWLLSIESLDQEEDHLVRVAMLDDGTVLDADIATRLLTVPGRLVRDRANLPVPGTLGDEAAKRQGAIQAQIANRNIRLLDVESEKLEAWADDRKLALESELKEIKRLISEARRVARAEPTLEAKLAARKRVKALETQQKEKQRHLFEAQDAVDAERQALIDQVESKLPQKTEMKELFAVRWRLC